MSALAKSIPRTLLGLSLLGLPAAAGILLPAFPACADGTTSMAPPVQTNAPQNAEGSTGADSVFNWREIPANQQVPLSRAAFDQGGYQLYDTVGETIIVPFTHQNLYVMKFAQSTNGKLYFENEGGYPVLYVPQDGYLDNATVSGARWYPFGQEFHPSEPVFLGVAPSYPEFIDMGWYPEMNCYGGYYGRTSFLSGGIFLPSAGLFFEFGGQPYYGWNGYHRYCENHPDFHRTDYYRRDFYASAGRPRTSFHQFGAAGRPYYAHRAFTGSTGPTGPPGASRFQSPSVGRSFRGAAGARQSHSMEQTTHRFSGQQSIRGQQSFSGRSKAGSAHVFQGTSNQRGTSQSGFSQHGFSQHGFSQRGMRPGGSSSGPNSQTGPSSQSRGSGSNMYGGQGGGRQGGTQPGSGAGRQGGGGQSQGGGGQSQGGGGHPQGGRH